MKRHVTTEDWMHIGIAAAAAFGIGMIIGKKQGTAVATAGLGEYFREPMSGLGAYYQNKTFIPISGLGGYVPVR